MAIRLIFICFFFTVCSSIFAQTVQISGYVTDEKAVPLPYSTVTIENTGFGGVTNEKGFYSFSFTYTTDAVVVFSSIGYATVKIPVPTATGNALTLNQSLRASVSEIGTINITSDAIRENNLQRIDPKLIEITPSASGDAITALLRTLGVSSNNELSTQYSVRGGNFDENLVYVNDVEIYRPTLTRSGQQEGLSFVNGDMVSSVLFSAGGFESRYGDKMSSVLDVRYRKPKKFGVTLSGSLTGSSVEVEGVSKNTKFTHLTGVRYKRLTYILGSLDEKGNYDPNFTDVQTYLTYTPNQRWEYAFLGNATNNVYNFIPQNFETQFGATGTQEISQSLQFNMYFDGKEQNRFDNYLSALSAEFRPQEGTRLKFIASAYRISEAETYDVAGAYFLNNVDRDPNSASFGDSAMNIGVGGFLRHARNYFDATMFNVQHRGEHKTGNWLLQWGATAQYEDITADINEWKMLDSAGFSIPYNGNSVGMKEFLRSSATLQSNRVSAYVQSIYSRYTPIGKLNINTGVRTQYWTINGQVVVSPRLILSLKPSAQRDIVFRLSAGMYNQPPFFKELRDFDGSINRNVKAQQSLHLVVGADYDFKLWRRKFKLVSEVYYKDLQNLVPYEVENVRIAYYANKIAKGYATGLDFKINGDFVKDAESWAHISLLRTHEDIDGDESGYIPRLTDQWLNVGVLFQDYIPGNRSYRAHLTGFFGSGLPFGPPRQGRSGDTLRIPSYKRFDIGFSKVLKSEDVETFRFLRRFKAAWVTLEVYNLLGIQNIVSFNWVSVVPNQASQTYQGYLQYAVPNYLTGRRINLKITVKI